MSSIHSMRQSQAELKLVESKGTSKSSMNTNIKIHMMIKCV